MLKILILVILIMIIVVSINYNYISSISENFSKSSGISSSNNLKLSTVNKSQNKLSIKNNISFNNKDYNENLSVDNKDLTYYDNDVINQSNINETSFNIINSIDPIDYADVKTGLEKCNQECKGTCFEMGYTGVATCYPKETQSFDWGTLYKNPTFTYGNNAYKSK